RAAAKTAACEWPTLDRACARTSAIWSCSDSTDQIEVAISRAWGWVSAWLRQSSSCTVSASTSFPGRVLWQRSQSGQLQSAALPVLPEDFYRLTFKLPKNRLRAVNNFIDQIDEGGISYKYRSHHAKSVKENSHPRIRLRSGARRT